MVNSIIKFGAHLCLIAIIIFWAYKTSELSQNYAILTAFALITIIYYSITIYRRIARKIELKQLKNQRIKKEQTIIESFLKNNFRGISIKELNDLILTMIKADFLQESIKGNEKQLAEQIKRAERKLEELEYKEEIDKLENEKETLKHELNEININKRQESINEKERKNKIKRNLDLDNNVFLTDELTDEEIEILKEEDYKQTNEYDISKQRVVTVLVKSILNHSSTHTFLVWSAIKYINDNIKAENIQEHQTKDADITFKYQGKYYAIEIETGSLLTRKKQLEEKTRYLNKKYHDRWFFIVSNRNLTSNYSKFGFTTQRKGASKMIQKILNFQHPPKPSVKQKR